MNALQMIDKTLESLFLRIYAKNLSRSYCRSNPYKLDSVIDAEQLGRQRAQNFVATNFHVQV
jgi:hypothetical protein